MHRTRLAHATAVGDDESDHTGEQDRIDLKSRATRGKEVPAKLTQNVSAVETALREESARDRNRSIYCPHFDFRNQGLPSRRKRGKTKEKPPRLTQYVYPLRTRHCDAHGSPQFRISCTSQQNTVPNSDSWIQGHLWHMNRNPLSNQHCAGIRSSDNLHV